MKKTILRNMKGFGLLCAFCVLGILLFNGCDAVVEDGGSTTEILITNESSYDLKISFELTEVLGFSSGQPDYHDYVDIEKGKSGSGFISAFLWANHPNPNIEIQKIIFSNKENGETIKELKLDNINPFKFIRSKSSKWGEEALYSFEILDELLQ